tara:strand:+ start:1170 stop:1874 length:705 start_codon:yes stop_codon:yes gene_type:complete
MFCGRVYKFIFSFIIFTNSITAMADDHMVGDFSANVTLTSDYSFRGISQTAEEPAIQGGLDWDSGTGFYLGTWGSNVNFGDGDETSMELDVYAGYAGSLNGLDYDVGFIYYIYPGANSNLNYDFWEIYGSLGYDFEVASFSAGLAYTSDNFGDTGDGLYLMSGLSIPLSDMFSLDASLNYYDVEPSFGDDYFDWIIGATLSIDWFDANISYIDTDISNLDAADSRVVFSISRSF